MAKEVSGRAARRGQSTEGVTRTVSGTQAQAAVMHQVAAKFDQANRSLEGMLSRLMRELDGLQSQWVGRGGRSFDQVRLAWAEDQKRLHTALAETASAIRSAGKVYTVTDDEAANRFTQSGITLPL
jgi:ESAT-6 family protein